MGVSITELLPKKEIALSDLSGKTLAVDASLWLYQFVSSIRQANGELLTNSKGQVTSHIIGLFSRLCSLSSKNIKLIFVFDGKPPELKQQVLDKRREIKEKAAELHKQAEEKGDADGMRKYASMTSRITPEMMEDAKNVVRAFGLPVVQAPSEAEAQAALIVSKGHADALATNDADALLFNAPKIVRNVNLAGRRKRTSKLAYDTISPDIIELAEALNSLGIEHDQLILLSMLVGTDYNPGGIKGIGPKNAIKLVKQFGTDANKLFEHVKWNEFFETPYNDVYNAFKHVETTEEYEISFEPPNKAKLLELLVDKHEFSAMRVENQLQPLKKTIAAREQKGLSDFFG